MYQNPFGSGWHESLQYHALCNDKAFAVRVFWTGSLWHHSAWVYDGGVEQLLNSAAPLTQSDAAYTDLHGPEFELFRARSGGFHTGRLSAVTESGSKPHDVRPLPYRSRSAPPGYERNHHLPG